jgi:hypothetical protein
VTLIVLRLPYIARLATSNRPTNCLTSVLFSRLAWLWATLAFNISPELGVTSASWVHPNGPLITALLGSIVCRACATRPGSLSPRSMVTRRKLRWTLQSGQTVWTLAPGKRAAQVRKSICKLFERIECQSAADVLHVDHLATDIRVRLGGQPAGTGDNGT